MRGGSPFDCGYELEKQSFVSGLYLFDNKAYQRDLPTTEAATTSNLLPKSRLVAKERMLHEKVASSLHAWKHKEYEFQKLQ